MLDCVVVATIAVGCVNVADTFAVHPLESVTTAVYVPANKLFSVKVVAPLDHKMV